MTSVLSVNGQCDSGLDKERFGGIGSLEAWRPGGFEAWKNYMTLPLKRARGNFLLISVGSRAGATIKKERSAKRRVSRGPAVAFRPVACEGELSLVRALTSHTFLGLPYICRPPMPPSPRGLEGLQNSRPPGLQGLQASKAPRPPRPPGLQA